jgi:hypothetical protein
VVRSKYKEAEIRYFSWNFKGDRVLPQLPHSLTWRTFSVMRNIWGLPSSLQHSRRKSFEEVKEKNKKIRKRFPDGKLKSYPKQVEPPI